MIKFNRCNRKEKRNPSLFFFFYIVYFLSVCLATLWFSACSLHTFCLAARPCIRLPEKLLIRLLRQAWQGWL